ncbi:MAG: aminotransferase class V-fold PLP-dependent enzyme, partial [Gammaproteobacteria bacterium]
MTEPAETVYLDYASTTPLDARVRECMLICLDQAQNYANPSSAHAAGQQAAGMVERAARDVAGLINAHPRELIWTSGATESDNLAILGAARFRRLHGNHVVTSVTEHKAVLESCRQLEREDFDVTYL